MGQIPVWLCIIIAVLAAGAAGAGGFFLGVRYRKNQAEATIGSAEEEAKRIVGSAVKTAEARKKEIVLEGKGVRTPPEKRVGKGARRPAQGDSAPGAAEPAKRGEPGTQAGKHGAQGRTD